MDTSLNNQHEIRALRLTTIFRDLSDDAMDKLLEKASVKMFKRSETIFMQGDPADAFFVMLNGCVKVYRMTPAGEEAVIHVFSRGESFAEAAAFLNKQYPSSCQAVTDCRIIRIPFAHFVQLMKQSPEIGLAMLASMSQHQHQLIKQIERLKAHTGAQRLAEFLLSLTEIRSGPCSLELPYDKALIAGRLGIKPESLSRAFQKLRGFGVAMKQNMAEIEDIAVLEQLVEKGRAEVMQTKRL